MTNANYKLYDLGGKVLQYYRNYVRGNEKASKALVRRKLTRNIELALKLSDNVDGRNTKLYAYGNLHMFVRDNKISKIINKKNSAPLFHHDKVKYDTLTEFYEIDKYERLCGIGVQAINTYSEKQPVTSEIESKGLVASFKSLIKGLGKKQEVAR